MTETITFERAIIDFPRALKKIRLEKGISQGDIFRKTGLERAYISRLENGNVLDPRISTVIILARALGVSIDEFTKEMLCLGEEKGSQKA